MIIKERNKNTAGTKRIADIADEGSFVELGASVTARETDIYSPEIARRSDGVITGYGTVEGRPVYIFCQDRDVMGGTFGEAHAQKIYELYRTARRAKAPVIGILDSKGMRIEEGADGLNAFARLCGEIAKAKDELIQIMAADGKCAGGMAVIAEMGDFLFDGEDESPAGKIRRLIGLLPSAKGVFQEGEETRDDLNRLCVNARENMGEPLKLLKEISDEGLVYEVGRNTKEETAAAFIKLNGRTVGVIAGGEGKCGGRITREEIKKSAEFAELCDRLNIALITIVNNTGVEAFEEKEGGGSAAEAEAALTIALVKSKIPKICLITGGASGMGYALMNSRGLCADMVFSWPEAEISMINPRQAVQMLWPETKAKDIGRIAEEYAEKRCGCERLLERGYIDKIIEPEESRKYLIGALEAFANAY